MTWNNQHADFFRLNPPESATVEIYHWAHDVSGNPIARYSISWNNGERGEAYKGGLFRSPRREQVGYRDKTSSAALWRLSELFPRTRWSISPAGITGSRAGDHATFEAVRNYDAEPVPVIFRTERSGEVTACFPTLPGDRDSWTFQIYAHIGQHGTGSLAWYRKTRAATEAESAPLRAELESAPYHYNLEPRARWSRDFDDMRRAALQRMNRAARASA
jgi:hypothetical protein